MSISALRSILLHSVGRNIFEGGKKLFIYVLIFLFAIPATSTEIHVLCAGVAINHSYESIHFQ